MNIYGTHWLSLVISVLAFGIIVIVRGPDTLAIIEAAVVAFSVIVGTAVGDRLDSLRVYEEDAQEWRQRCFALEEAIRDYERLSMYPQPKPN